MPHTTRVSVIDADGEIFYISRKTAAWLHAEGLARWAGPERMQLRHKARELRGRPSAGYITLQLVELSHRRRR